MKHNALQYLFRIVAVVAALICGGAQWFHGQELTVVDCRSTLDTMTVDMQRRDINNEICAMARVELPIAGVTFEGNFVNVHQICGAVITVVPVVAHI